MSDVTKSDQDLAERINTLYNAAPVGWAATLQDWLAAHRLAERTQIITFIRKLVDETKALEPHMTTDETRLACSGIAKSYAALANQLECFTRP